MALAVMLALPECFSVLAVSFLLSLTPYTTSSYSMLAMVYFKTSNLSKQPIPLAFFKASRESSSFMFVSILLISTNYSITTMVASTFFTYIL